jgi:signal recognition particle receptor subunit beta
LKKKEVAIAKLQRENEMMRFKTDDRSQQALIFTNEQDSSSAVSRHIEESLSSLACLKSAHEVKVQENKSLQNKLSIALT